MITVKEFEKILKLLRELISDTVFDNHVFFARECVADYMQNKPTSNIYIAIDLVKGGENFSNWLNTKTRKNPETKPLKLANKNEYLVKLTGVEGLENICLHCYQTRYNLPSIVKSKREEDNFGSLLNDAKLADLSIHSMYIDITDGVLVDPTFNGMNDLTDGILKTPSVSDLMFRCDPLRMLRIIRYASKTQWNVDKETWFAILKNHELIKNVSKDEVRDEFNKILLTEEPSIGLRRLMNSGMLFDICPQLYQLNRIGRFNPLFKDNIWEHTLNVVDNTTPSIVTRLGGLFHDIGKLTTYITKGGSVHFYNHEVAGETITKAVLAKMGYGQSVSEDVMKIVKLHMRFSSFGDTYDPTDKLVRRFIADCGDARPIVLDVMGANIKAHKTPKIMLFNRLLERIDEVIEEDKKVKVTLPIDGKDIMEELKIKACPMIGEILKYVESKMSENPTMTKTEAIKLMHEYVLQHNTVMAY